MRDPKEYSDEKADLRVRSFLQPQSPRAEDDDDDFVKALQEFVEEERSKLNEGVKSNLFVLQNQENY